MNQPEKVIAFWDVAAETYAQLVQEATADAQLFMHGYPFSWAVDVVNATPNKFEDRRVTEWKGQALITLRPKEAGVVYRNSPPTAS